MCSEDSLYEAVNAFGSERLLTIDSKREEKRREVKGAMPERTKGGGDCG